MGGERPYLAYLVMSVIEAFRCAWLVEQLVSGATPSFAQCFLDVDGCEDAASSGRCPSAVEHKVVSYGI